MKPRRYCPPRCRAVSACRLCLPPATTPAVWQSLFAVLRTRCGRSTSWLAGGASSLGRPDAGAGRTRRRARCACIAARLRGIHASGGAGPQEHPGLRADRLGQDHLDQGTDPRDSRRRAPGHHRGCAASWCSIAIPNHVRLFYSKDDQGQARVTPKQLLECCLRMRPDRILLAELRAEEAFDYLRNVNSGHLGSITSVHATSAELAFEQLVLLVKQSPAGRIRTPGHQESAVPAGRCGNPVRGRATRALHSEDMVPPGAQARPGRSAGGIHHVSAGVDQSRTCCTWLVGFAVAYAAVQAPDGGPRTGRAPLRNSSLHQCWRCL